MAEDETMTEEAAPERRLGGRLRKYLLAAVLGLFALVGLGVVLLNSPIGHRFVVDQISSLAPASGLRIEIGRIEGSLYGEATLHDVELSDPKGRFLEVPEVKLDWRPFNWWRSGLDVRKLVLRRGTLHRLPELKPGDPDAPILPNFDIRIDDLRIEGLRVAEGVVDGPRRVDLAGKVDIRDGRALVRANARASGGDRLALVLDAEPDGDKFDIELDYRASDGGLFAELTGAEAETRARIVGDGTWSDWRGSLLIDYAGVRAAALQLGNRSGRYSARGLVWPGDLLTGIPARAAGQRVEVDASGTLENSLLDGRLQVLGAGVLAKAQGKVDLAGNAVEDLELRLGLRDPDLLGEDIRLEGAGLYARLDGKFRDLTIEHALVAERVVAGTTRANQLVQSGVASYDGTRWTLPLNLRAARIVTGNETVDPRLVNVRADGTIALSGSRLTSENLSLVAPGLAARLVLRGDLDRGDYALAGPVAARGFVLEDLGQVNADARILFRIGSETPWRLAANLSGRMVRVDNSTLTSLAGTNIRFSAALTTGGDRPLAFQRATLDASKLNLQVSGRVAGGTTTLAGGGRHADYGRFTVEARLAADGPHATLVFANPLPAAGLKDVRVALSPIPDGFRIETSGGSMLGPFEGTLGLFSRPGGPTRIDIDRLDVWKTAVTGGLVLGDGGVDGTLTLAGGGVDGTISLTPQGGGQGVRASLAINNARFGGDTPITVTRATVEANGQIGGGRTTIAASLTGQGIGYGNLFLGRVNARANLQDGRGRITAALAGRRGARFNLQVAADVAPDRYAVIAGGEFAGQKITMPRRAILTNTDDGWRLAPTQVNYAGGRMIGSGLLGGGATEIQLALDAMPLALADAFGADLGLGGKASGLVDIQSRGGVPTGDVRLKIDDLSRSGLMLTSRPIDLALVARLNPTSLEARAVAYEGGQLRGRIQALISGLPRSGGLAERLNAGSLTAQLRYDGPADALWRLAAIDAFDLTGPLKVAADIGGSLSNPTIRGSLASDSLHLSSTLVGTDVTQITARGFFAGSRLTLTRFSGRAGDGTVTGSGTVDLTDLGEKGPAIDIKLAARNARLMNQPGMSAVVTGPMRIVSDGTGGTIAGRLKLERASWRLGQASGVADLPSIPTREINAPADIAPRRARSQPWRLLIDAEAANQIDVRGMGMNSEWSADLRIRGTAASPVLYGRADFIRGGYEFAGTRFELIRGRINFDGSNPPDPRLDILAEAQVTGLTARVTIQGSASRPDIAFTSTPALAEDELLARLLFGSSITQISAAEALQLGAALASLRGGGGGLDPINKLRTAIGLDRLRIVAADPALGRGTGVAAGKYLGDKFYVEIVTDGRGYNATQIEYRITSWLSLLASISTIGRESINVKISKDY
jgi:translocation and assembly module TamB